MNNRLFMHRHRRAIVRLCVAATLLLGLGAQLHGLSHSLQAVQAPAHKDPMAAHTLACEQCLQFAALEGGMTAHATALLPIATSESAEPGVPATPLRASAFTAYVSRAPPQRG